MNEGVKKEENKLLERGSIYFLYRPAVEESTPKGLEDVQRFFIILYSRDVSKRYRLIVIGHKKLPEIKPGRTTYWGYVEKVSADSADIRRELEPGVYPTSTRGSRFLPGARPVGEGVYAVARHGNHTHLVYALELPRRPGPAQRVFNIEMEGSFIVSIKNPEAATPPGLGLPEEKKADFPDVLRERFGGRRFANADPPTFLDFAGAELLLIGAAEDIPEDLVLELDKEHELIHATSIFQELKLDRSAHPPKPLFEGEWE